MDETRRPPRAPANAPCSEACNQDCLACLPQFLPSAYQLESTELERLRIDDDEAREKLSKAIAVLTRDRERIGILLNTFGDEILTRWTKKTKRRREAILLEANPDMYPKKWPMLRAQNGLDRHNATRTLHQDGSYSILSKLSKTSAMLPYFDVETLTEDPMRLLSMLHHRATSHPEDWAFFDAMQMRFTWSAGGLVSNYNNNCVIMHGREYGKLVPWDRNKCHEGLQVGFPLALRIITAQALLCGNLRAIVDTLIQSQERREGSLKWLNAVESGFRSSGKVSALSTCRNQAFSAPPKFDPQRDLKNARAFLAANTDELWFLQTDPEYLQRYLAMHSQIGHISGSSGDSMWLLLATHLAIQPAEDVRLFRFAIDILEHIVQLQEKLGGSFRRSCSRPQECDEALTLLFAVCKFGTQHFGSCLRMAVAQSKGFQHSMESVRAPDGKPTIRVKPADTKDGRNLEQALFATDPLLFILWTLGADPRLIQNVDTHLYMSWLDDYLANANHQERSRVDQRINTVISYLMFYHRLSVSVVASGLIPAKSVKEVYNDNPTADWTMLQRYSQKRTGGQPTMATKKQLATALRDFHNYPWPKGTRDQEWLRKATACRARLAAVWTLCRKAALSIVPEDSLRPEELKYEIDLFSASDSAQYQAEVEAERQVVLERLAKPAAPKPVAAIEVQSQWGEHNPSKLVLPVGRTKQETRPAQLAVAEPSSPVLDPFDHPETPRSTIAVSHASVLIFNKMFRSSEIAAQATGTIKWQQLVSAMTDAGFAATSNGGGSAVTFEAESVGSIVFHRPHPDPEVDAIMLHNMGRRLTKWFGWEHGTFVEKQKEQSI